MIILLLAVHDCPGGRTAAIARHVSFSQITCFTSYPYIVTGGLMFSFYFFLFLILISILFNFYARKQNASRVLAILSVCPSVRLSHS